MSVFSSHAKLIDGFDLEFIVELLDSLGSKPGDGQHFNQARWDTGIQLSDFPPCAFRECFRNQAGNSLTDTLDIRQSTLRGHGPQVFL